MLSETAAPIGAESIPPRGHEVASISDEIPLADLANALFDELTAVCNGNPARAEALGQNEFAIFRVGCTF